MRRGRNKKNHKHRDVEFITTADRAGKQKMGRADAYKNSENFDKMEGPCPRHDFLVKHLFKDCDLFKRYLKGDLAPAFKGKRSEPGKGNKEEDALPRPEGYLMIFSRPAAYESRLGR